MTRKYTINHSNVFVKKLDNDSCQKALLDAERMQAVRKKMIGLLRGVAGIILGRFPPFGEPSATIIRFKIHKKIGRAHV